ncbi:MAG: transcriptional regulator [Desulfobacteraceae bacterium]|nr:MAG: transcriptional regulator [Desulfobacteraceae bacterium]
MGFASWISKACKKSKTFFFPRRTCDPASGVKCFDDYQKEESAFDYRDRGIRTVQLKAVVGSVGRYQDFDSRFQPRQHLPTERLEWIKEAMQQGKVFEPVKLYQIKDEYYVLDGNHRISAAKALGNEEILAQVIEFIPGRNTFQNILYFERSEFADKTRLTSEIGLTEAGHYVRLLDQIAFHEKYLKEEQHQEFTFSDAAQDWYKTIYRPLYTIIKRSRLIEKFPKRTIADLYAYISYHQWTKLQKRAYGIGIDKLIPKDMEAFRKKMADIKDNDYPEMKRGITAFILMSVDGNREFRIMEKLFHLEEVKEVHSVHGDADILVKVELTRDLLCSDAEVISQFVHVNFRKLQGVKSTKTLIPGFSKIK